MNHLTPEQIIVIILFVLSYFVAMLIQVFDHKKKLKIKDWIIGFLSSLLGGATSFLFSLKWSNLGLRVGFIIFISIFSYRILRNLTEDESQEITAKGVVTKIKKMMDIDPDENKSNNKSNNN